MASPCTRRAWSVVWVAWVLLAGGCTQDEGAEGPPTLWWYVFREPSGAFARAAAECTRAAGGRYRIEIAELPADADQQRIQIARRLAARDPDLDVLGLDVIWTAELAGGQRQRVATGRAIVREPAVFLMDEPLSNLDARLRLETRAQILRLQRRLGTTMVYVTHDQTEAMTLAHRLAVLRRGTVEQVGTPRELYRKPATRFVASFLGSPPINLVEGRLRAGRLVLPWAPGEGMALPDSLREAAEGRSGPVVAGLRPEALRAARNGPAGEGGREVAFTARVALVEWLGPEAYVHAEVEGAELVARLAAEVPVASGDRLELVFDPLDLHLFELESGERLGPAGGR